MNEKLRQFLIRALEEDIGTGDVTTEAIVDEDSLSSAVLIAKEDFVLAGTPFAKEVFRMLDSAVDFESHAQDGNMVKRGESIARVKARTRALLQAERTALNILQRLSGIATLTRRFVEKLRGTPVRILDTRKTTPNMRYLEKYAVKVGGGYNHRFGLYDGILIKDNHIRISGGIKEAVERVRKNGTRMLKVEVEVENFQELQEALESPVDIIMLDNMEIDEIKRAVQHIRQQRPDVAIEASGGVRLENIEEIAKTGVDFISVGYITHSATSVDISLEIEDIG